MNATLNAIILKEVYVHKNSMLNAADYGPLFPVQVAIKRHFLKFNVMTFAVAKSF